MGLSSKQVEMLISAVELTKEEELDCDGCMTELAQFAEHELEGKPIPEAVVLVQEHLRICPECCEEYGVLLAALKELHGPFDELG
ncbi:MAG: hypothetical protein ACFCD0_28025 [Gemmataceae bacterium]